MDGIDFQLVISDANSTIESQFIAADAEFLLNDLRGAFNRLIELIRTNSGKERDLVRDRLVELFEIAGSTHPDVVSARTSLANALF
jgi:putative thioredoxin